MYVFSVNVDVQYTSITALIYHVSKLKLGGELWADDGTPSFNTLTNTDPSNQNGIRTAYLTPF